MANDFDLSCACQRLVKLDHLGHEEIIRALQDNPDPGSIVFLQRAIAQKPQLAYLEYDDYGAYYKKCLWALQAIGTREAIAVIESCARSEIPELRAQALHRLARIGSGLPSQKD